MTKNGWIFLSIGIFCLVAGLVNALITGSVIAEIATAFGLGLTISSGSPIWTEILKRLRGGKNA